MIRYFIFSIFVIANFSSQAAQLNGASQKLSSSQNLSEFYDEHMTGGVFGLQQSCILSSMQDYQVYLSQNRSADPDMNLPENEVLFRMGYLKNDHIIPSEQNCFLTTPELVAIKKYTDGGYFSINNALRLGDVKELQRLKLVIKYLISGLNKLKDYKSFVKRGAQIPISVLQKNHIAGNSVQYFSFLSTSTLKPFSGNIQYLIKSNHCKYIAPFSSNPQEEEVLCLPGAKYKIIYSEVKNEVFRIYMEEVSQKFDLDEYIAEVRG